MDVPRFSDGELDVFEQTLAELEERLQALQFCLDGESDDIDIEKALSETNRQIHELRKQWRSMMRLPPPRH